MLRLGIAVDTPQHAALGGVLTYLSERPLAPGTLVSVPLGRRTVPGVVWADAPPVDPDWPDDQLRPVGGVLEGLPPLSASWRALVNFAAAYYQRSVGELALAVLPPELRRLDDAALARRRKRRRKYRTL